MLLLEMVLPLGLILGTDAAPLGATLEATINTWMVQVFANFSI